MEKINLEDIGSLELNTNWNVSANDKVKIYTPNGRPIWVDPADIPYKLSKYFISSGEVEQLDSQKLEEYFENFENETRLHDIPVTLRFKSAKSFTNLYNKTINKPLSEYIAAIKIGIESVDGKSSKDSEEAEQEITSRTLNEAEPETQEKPVIPGEPQNDDEKAPVKSDNVDTEKTDEEPGDDSGEEDDEDNDEPKIFLIQTGQSLRTVYYVVENDTRFVFVWDFIDDADGKIMMFYTDDTLDLFKTYSIKEVLKNLYTLAKNKGYQSISVVHTNDVDDKNRNPFFYSLLGFSYSSTKQKYSLATQYINIAEQQFKIYLEEDEVSSMTKVATIVRKLAEGIEIPKSFILKDGRALVGKYLIDRIKCELQELNLGKDNNKYMLNFLNNNVNKLEQLKYILGESNE